MRRAVVLGGYGLIGSAVMAALAGSGFAVTGIGRSRPAALASDPGADWVICDLAALDVQRWRDLLCDADVVVNAAGALQDGARDDLQAIHVDMLRALTQALAGRTTRLIQISAAGAVPDASTVFLHSKAVGDALIAASGCDWVIFRPVLVLAADAYGGTALLRAVAALPGVVPRVLPEAMVQTVAMTDLTRAVVLAAERRVPTGTIADLTETEAHPFPDLVARIRHRLGYPPPRWAPTIPAALLRLVGRVADGLGHLGWRSPLRSTALTALQDGIRGDPAVWAALGHRCAGLERTLTALPSTRQDRLFARMQLALPLAIGVLALFWSLSGVIGLALPGEAADVLTARGMAPGPARAVVICGALADLGLGLGLLWRPWARAAALAMTGLAGGYLIGSLFVAPDLWANPLGPMLKVLPAMVLSITVWLVLEAR